MVISFDEFMGSAQRIFAFQFTKQNRMNGKTIHSFSAIVHFVQFVDSTSGDALIYSILYAFYSGYTSCFWVIFFHQDVIELNEYVQRENDESKRIRDEKIK